MTDGCQTYSIDQFMMYINVNYLVPLKLMYIKYDLINIFLKRLSFLYKLRPMKTLGLFFKCLSNLSEHLHHRLVLHFKNFTSNLVILYSQFINYSCLFLRFDMSHIHSTGQGIRYKSLILTQVIPEMMTWQCDH